jgi:hypothetical protein
VYGLNAGLALLTRDGHKIARLLGRDFGDGWETSSGSPLVTNSIHSKPARSGRRVIPQEKRFTPRASVRDAQAPGTPKRLPAHRRFATARPDRPGAGLDMPDSRDTAEKRQRREPAPSFLRRQDRYRENSRPGGCLAAVEIDQRCRKHPGRAAEARSNGPYRQRSLWRRHVRCRPAGPSRLYAAFSSGTSGIACEPRAIALAGQRRSSSR